MPELDVNEIDFARLGAPAGARLAIVGGHGGIGQAAVRRGIEIGLDVVALDTPNAIEQYPLPDGDSWTGWCISVALERDLHPCPHLE